MRRTVKPFARRAARRTLRAVSSESRVLPRSKVVAQPPTGVLRAASARIDITPGFNTPMTGWGWSKARRIRAMAGRLHATVLLLEDAEGHRVALVAADLHSGPRFVAEHIAMRTASLGIGIAEVFLSGTHTHAAAGNFNGNPYYDSFTGAAAGVDESWVLWLSSRVAQAIETAHTQLRPAVIGFGEETLLGWSRNRSLPAYLNNFPPKANPPTPGDDRHAVDPQVRCLWAQEPNGTPIGGFATFGAHGTIVPGELAMGSADWFGEAVRVAERSLSLPANAFLGLAAGAIGDVDPAHPSYSEAELLQKRGTTFGALQLIAQVGDAVGCSLADACDDARAHSLSSTACIVTRFAEPVVAGAALRDGRRLASRPDIGTSTLAGSEMGRGIGWEGWRTSLDDSDPQSPKPVVPLGPIRDALLLQPRTMPLRLVSVGDVLLAGLPGEPTVMLASALRDELNAPSLMVCGVTGDYAGYLTTPREYESQHYEGASTIWGRWSGDWVVEQFVSLQTQGSTPVANEIVFNLRPVSAFRFDQPAPPGDSVPEWQQPPSAYFDAANRRAWGSWFGYALSSEFEMGQRAWVSVVDAHSGVELLNDQQHPMVLAYDVHFNTIEWRWSFIVPPALFGRSVRIVSVGPAGVGVRPPAGSRWPMLQLEVF